MGAGVIRIPAAVLRAMREHAAEAYPEECCGGLFGDEAENGIRRVVRSAPVDGDQIEQRERRYLIGPEQFAELERQAAAEGRTLIGFYHSHPDHPAVPSTFDREHAWPWYTYVIVPVARGSAGAPRVWVLAEDRSGFEEQGISEDGDAQ